MMQGASSKKIYLADLKHGPVPETVCVRVMRKWLYDGNQNNSNGKYIGLVLADEKGDYIYAQITSNHITSRGEELDLDKTYLIRKFMVKASKQMFVPFIKKFMVELNGYTVISTVRDPPEGLPAYVYNLTAYADLNPIYPQNTIYVDVLGIIVSVGGLQEQFVSSQEKNVPMREIVIKDSRDEELKITLWAEHATSFALHGARTPETAQSIVVLFVGGVPKNMNHNTQVNGSYGCRWYFNPTIREAQPLYESLRKKPVPVYQPEDSVSETSQPAKPTVLEHKKLSEMNDEDPFAFAREGYKCTVTITDIPQEQKYWYIGCAGCKKAVREDIAAFYCHPCKCSQTKPYYKLSFIAEDDTAQGDFFAYEVAARNIVHREARAVLNQQAKEPGFPRFLKEIIGKKYTLHVLLRQESFDRVGENSYLVKTMMVDHEYETYKAQRQLQRAQGSSLPSMQSPLRLTSSAIDPSTPDTSNPLDVTETPPPTASPNTTPTEAKMASSSHKSEGNPSARRALFRDGADDEPAQLTQDGSEAAAEDIAEDAIEDATNLVQHIPEKKNKRHGAEDSNKQQRSKQRKQNASAPSK